MLAALLLMCSIREPTDCRVILLPKVYTDQKECLGDGREWGLEIMTELKGYGPVEYRCIPFNYRFPNV